MLYNSLLFNKIESPIGVDKWVKSIRHRRKTVHETIIQIYFFIFGRKETENI
jgi:hypothetical protein